MAGGSLGFVVELLVAMLLVVTIGYCLVVNRKLERLRSDQSELKKFIRELNAATMHAERAIAGLQKSAGNAEEMLGSHVENARELSSRLAEGIADGEEIYAKLELFNQMQRRGVTPKNARPSASHGLKARTMGLARLNIEESGAGQQTAKRDAA